MASLGKATFKSKTGNHYRFKVFPLGTRFRKISGIYMIAYRAHGAHGGYRHKVLFVGNTEDFSQPFEKHHKAEDLVRLRRQLHLRAIGQVGEVSAGKGAGPDCRLQSRRQRLTRGTDRLDAGGRFMTKVGPGK